MPGACRLPGCPISRTGTCLEAIEDVTRCPNYLPSGAVEEATAAEAPPKPKGVQLPVATAMVPERTYEITRSSLARVIVLAGEHRSGKTTLLASLYDAFQTGHVGGDLVFAGSRTLHGFERRCHLSRVASGLDRPDTDRTKGVEGFQFLHLRVMEDGSKTSTDLLIGDMSGELYKGIRNSSEECAKYPFLGRVHDFVVLLDGDKIAIGEHAEAYGHANSLVRALLDADILGVESRLTLLTTKWDRLQRPGRDAERARVDNLEAHFREACQSRVGQIVCARSAARPDSGQPVGLQEMLRSWLTTPELARKMPLRDESPARRWFDLYRDVRRAASPWARTW